MDEVHFANYQKRVGTKAFGEVQVNLQSRMMSLRMLLDLNAES